MVVSRVVVAALGVVLSLASAAAQESLPEFPSEHVSNWTAPPYWHPAEAVGKDIGELVLEQEDLGVEPLGALPTAPIPFVAITPCRIVDTRGPAGPFGGPALLANASRTFNLPAGPCPGLPSDARAWSLNFTVIGGAGTFQGGFLTAWPTGDSQPTVSTLNFNADQLVANAAVVPAGTSGPIDVFVNAPADLLIDINGYYGGVAIVNTINGLSGAVTLAPGSNITITPSGNTLTIANTAPAAWLLTGNSLSIPGQFLGTTNNQALELKVNGQRALRLEPNPTSPNVVGGFSGNAALGPHGSTIAGGGFSGSANVVIAHFGTVGGGYDNQVQGTGATIPGGSGNVALGDNSFSAGTASFAAGSGSFALGSSAQAIHPGAFVWSCCAAGGGSLSSRNNEFQVRADGGAAFLRGLPVSAATSAALQAENGPASGEAAWLFNRNSANADDVVRALKHPSAPGNFFRCTNYDGTTAMNKCHIDANGAFTAGSDFAEALPARGGKSEFAPGDVLVMSGDAAGSVERSWRPYDTRVIGVYSTRPAVLGADKGGETRVDPDDVPVAITGIVPTKVTSENGTIRPGDLLTTSSTPGYAMKATMHPPGAIVGKALEKLDEVRGTIRVLVVMR